MPQFSVMSAHKEVGLNSIAPQFSGGSQDQASVNNVRPQSSGMSAQSNQQTAYKKVGLNSVLPQFSGVSAHKEVSLNSILPQSMAGRKIKKTLGHSLLACQRDPTSKLHTRKSDWTVSVISRL